MRKLKLFLRRFLLIILAASAVVTTLSALNAATYTWSGAGDIFDSATNWGGVLPSASGDTASWNGTVGGPLALVYQNGLFAGSPASPGLNIVLTAAQTGSLDISAGTTAPIQIGSVSIAAGAGSFSFGNTPAPLALTMGGSAGGAQTFDNESANTATINSDVVMGTIGGSPHNYLFTGAGNWLLNNNITDSTGTVSFTKSGAGIATLTGSNTYSGATSVNGGALLVNGSLTASAVAVNPFGVLGGSGSVGGPVVVNPGGALAPGGAMMGGSPSLFTAAGNLTLSASSALNYLLGSSGTLGPAGGNDFANVGGALAANPSLTLNVVPGPGFNYGNYPLIGYGSLADSSSSFSGWSVTGLAPSTGITFATTGSRVSVNLTTPTAPAAPAAPVYPAPYQTPTPNNHPVNHLVGYNENVVNTTGTTETTCNIVLNGNFDQAGDVVNNYPTFGLGTTSSTSYNATNNTTTITISGTQGVAPGQSGHMGYSLLNGTGGGEEESPETAYKYWGPLINNTPQGALRLPAPSFYVTNPGQGPNTVFVLLYATIELANGQTSGEWSEQQIPANQPFQLGLGNNDMLDGNMFAFNVGFQFSNTEIPLDDLNLTDYPPSSFTPLPGIPDGTGIGPGESVESLTLQSTPEPSSLALLAAAGCLLAGGQYSKRRKPARPPTRSSASNLRMCA